MSWRLSKRRVCYGGLFAGIRRAESAGGAGDADLWEMMCCGFLARWARFGSG